MKRGKNSLKKFIAAETLNNIAILSQKRQQQGSYFNVCLLGEPSVTIFFVKSWRKLKL